VSEPRVCAVAGASGYVGGRLVDRLVTAGHEVVALGRHESTLPATARRKAVDVADAEGVADALADVDTAYYLVHSLDEGAGFSDRDKELGESFAAGAAKAGVRRVVYLGGRGRGELSEHLQSRQEVGRALGSTGVEVVELRAAVVIGAGSISFEMLRYLTERLPVMVCPRWITTRVQPIAERDLLSYLEQAPTVPPGVYEIGGPEATTYRDMIATYARVRGLARRRIVDVPMLTPSLSARWVDLVTPVDRRVSHALIESLTTEVVVTDPAPARDAFAIEPVGVAEAITQALDDQAARLPGDLMGFEEGLRDGVYAMRSAAPLPTEDRSTAVGELNRCGGRLGWYGLAFAWWLRLQLGKAFGERLRLQRPPAVVVGAEVDWWTVQAKTDDLLILETRRWFCGEAWLGYRVTTPPEPEVELVAALRTKGLVGFVYWRLLWPIHLVVFKRMSRSKAGQARRD
jgi:uncharacterized protein YbjT (DUF2867 family)